MGMNRVLTFLLHHSFIIVIDIVIICFIPVLLFMQRSISHVTTPSRPPEVIETKIGPLNTKTFDTIKEAIQKEAAGVHLDWSILRNPFLGS